MERSLTYHLYAQAEEPKEFIAQETVQFKDLPEGQTALSRQKKDADCEDRDEFTLDQESSLLSWTRQCGEGTDITLERKGDKLIVKGVLNGKNMDKEIELGGQALHVYPKHSLSKFAMSGEPKINFWALRRDKMDKLPMQAVNKGEGTIDVNGGKVEVIKVYYSITPKLREKHYNHHYYFRKSDGVLVKVEESKGRIEELVKEE
jgi:hypothetical protein